MVLNVKLNMFRMRPLVKLLDEGEQNPYLMAEIKPGEDYLAVVEATATATKLVKTAKGSQAVRVPILQLRRHDIRDKPNDVIDIATTTLKLMTVVEMAKRDKRLQLAMGVRLFIAEDSFEITNKNSLFVGVLFYGKFK